jgi:hypothetical protein
MASRIKMNSGSALSAAAVTEYLRGRRRWVRWLEWLFGRRYLPARLGDRPSPLFVVAHRRRDTRAARRLALAVEQDWMSVPDRCRGAYEETLSQAPGLIVVQMRRENACGCLGHRHPVVKEAPFAESHDALGGVGVGEMDIAYKPVETWQALPLSDIAMDVKFSEGSRLEEFHKFQFRLKLLSILLHETHHLVSPQEEENDIRRRSLAFYHDALADYVENTTATLSLTIDRSFYRFG